MKWSHLPVEGGLYDQHPKLLEQWRYIFAMRAKYEAEKDRERQREQEAKSRAGKQSPGMRGRASRSR